MWSLIFSKISSCRSAEQYKENSNKSTIFLTLSWQRPLSYRNQSIDLLRKSMDWFLYDKGVRQERVKSAEHFLSNHFLSVVSFCTSWKRFQKAYEILSHKLRLSAANIGRSSTREMVLRMSENSQKQTCAGFFLIKLNVLIKLRNF